MSIPGHLPHTQQGTAQTFLTAQRRRTRGDETRIET
jgi:hypothetical protein